MLNFLFLSFVLLLCAARCVWTSLPVPEGSSQNGKCGAVAGWQTCGGHPSTGCSEAQAPRLLQYGARFLNDLQVHYISTMGEGNEG